MNEPNSHAGLELVSIDIRLDNRLLVAISATIPAGTILTVMGPSGTGKSTLLSCVGGFLQPDFKASGNIVINGEDITNLSARGRRAGVLFQESLLFPHMSTGENVAFGVPAAVGDRRTRTEIAAAALADVELDGFAGRDPSTLSGGQKARVALARVLVSKPRFLLLDEPFSKLDSALRGQMRHLVFSRSSEAGLPVIMVTHDEADAEAAGGPIHRL